MARLPSAYALEVLACRVPALGYSRARVSACARLEAPWTCAHAVGPDLKVGIRHDSSLVLCGVGQALAQVAADGDGKESESASSPTLQVLVGGPDADVDLAEHPVCPRGGGEGQWATDLGETPLHEILVDDAVLLGASDGCRARYNGPLRTQGQGLDARPQEERPAPSSSSPGARGACHEEVEEEKKEGRKAESAGQAGDDSSRAPRATAWATLVYDLEYLPGALTVLHSLGRACAARPQRDFVLLVALAQDDEGERREDALLFSGARRPPEGQVGGSLQQSGATGHGPDVQTLGREQEQDRETRRARRVQKLEALAMSVGARVKFVEAILSPHEQMVGREDLRAAYSKMHVWNLTEYRWVVYLDADLLILRCPDQMFDGTDQQLDARHFAMGSWPFSAKRVWYDEGGRRHFSRESLGVITCAFLAQPGEDLFYTMLALSEVAPSFDGSDGGLLNGFFPDHHLWPPHLVAWKRTVSKFKMVWTDFSVSAVDFTGRPKPWHLSWLRRADPVDKVYYLPLFLEWWEKWFAYRKALPGSGASIHHWALGPL